jgi:hypothetical protein
LSAFQNDSLKFFISFCRFSKNEVSAGQRIKALQKNRLRVPAPFLSSRDSCERKIVAKIKFRRKAALPRAFFGVRNFAAVFQADL